VKIAIAYATKSGTAELAAQALARALTNLGHEAECFDLRRGLPVAHADAWVLGGSVRMGRLHQLARRFARSREAELLNKPLALYVCRCGNDPVPALLAGQLGQKLADHAVYAGCLGGMLDPERQKGLARMLVRMMLKSGDASGMYAPGIVAEQVDACAQALNGAMNA